jgi:UPF0716 protein FxsA
MAVYIALAFILVPIIEIAIFLEVGGEIGLWNTLAVVVLTAIVGTWMLRAQGMRTLRRAQDSLARQVFPVSEVFDGVCLLVAGALLLTPGFLTDALGFVLFLPPVRAAIRGVIQRSLSASGTIWMDGDGRGGGDSATPHHDNDKGRTIEGEFREVPPERRGDDEGAQ